MPYIDIVWRSFRISWNHKYLWLIALFSGEGGGGFNFNASQPASGQGQPPDFAAFQTQVTTWINEHIGLIVALVILWLVLIVAFFILAAVCEGATVRASAEHDAERPFRLGLAWQAGVQTMWAMIRFRLLLIAIGLPLLILFVVYATAVVIAIVNQNAASIFPLLFSGVLLVAAAIPYALYVFFLDRLGTRALVLEQLGARSSIVRAHRLLFKRIGRSLLIWVIALAVGIVVGILVAVAFGIVAIPFAIVAVGLFVAHSNAFWPLAVLFAIILVPISLVVGGFLAAVSSTYWTLAFRRLDLDYPPATA
ncbi:MAG TPA: hypothetical protein VGR23_04640 [Candidatus Dormibacteraeota bacterium]|jgi:hypothetical protein|nr:hypothetical protein [Candidatus Dormibacteraeota bacterium]